MKVKIHAGQVNQVISGDIVNIAGGLRDASRDAEIQERDAFVQLLPQPQTATRIPTRNSVRSLLSVVLVSSIDLDAFCMDFFPDVYHLFAAGMQVEERRNLLLWRTRPEVVLSALCGLYPQRVKENECLLVYE